MEHQLLAEDPGRHRLDEGVRGRPDLAVEHVAASLLVPEVDGSTIDPPRVLERQREAEEVLGTEDAPHVPAKVGQGAGHEEALRQDGPHHDLVHPGLERLVEVEDEDRGQEDVEVPPARLRNDPARQGTIDQGQDDGDGQHDTDLGHQLMSIEQPDEDDDLAEEPEVGREREGSKGKGKAAVAERCPQRCYKHLQHHQEARPGSETQADDERPHERPLQPSVATQTIQTARARPPKTTRPLVQTKTRPRRSLSGTRKTYDDHDVHEGRQLAKRALGVRDDPGVQIDTGGHHGQRRSMAITWKKWTSSAACLRNKLKADRQGSGLAAKDLWTASRWSRMRTDTASTMATRAVMRAAVFIGAGRLHSWCSPGLVRHHLHCDGTRVTEGAL